MARARHAVIALFAVLALLVAVQPISARAAGCPLDSAMTMPRMHHHSNVPAPMSPGAQYCPVCLGVLPPLPAVEAHVLPPVALIVGEPRMLFGIDPALDPPPPRGA
jgi:hypothetical protein